VTVEEGAAKSLAQRERDRDEYFLRRDPIYRDRLDWQAHTFRHLVHLLPGDTVLEIGAGQGLFVEALKRVTRGQVRITAVTFDPLGAPIAPAGDVEWIRADALSTFDGRSFHHIVLHNVLDARYATELLDVVFRSLEDGGNLVCYESNPWNPYHIVKNFVRRIFRRPTRERLLNQPSLYERISDIGFARIMIRFTDFVYPPLPAGLIWLFKNLSIVLENAPYVRTLAGRVLITARRPSLETERPAVSLARHEMLKNKLAIVVPCHNEEANVGRLVHGLVRHYSDYIRQIVLVDDNSRDRTREVIEALAREDARVKGVFRTPPNGVGLALRDGLAAVDPACDYVLTMDCDFFQLLPELEDIFDAAATGHAAAVGSRFSRKSVLINYPLPKIIANRGFHVLFDILCRRRCRDLTNNLKLMRADVVHRLRLTSDGFAINAEIGLQLALMGCGVEEVPISWVNRGFDMGASSFRVLRAGGGYAKVLSGFVRETRFGAKPLDRP
jgi:SAM-dependent methyltransferase